MESIFDKLLPTGVQVGEEVRRDGGLYIGGSSLKNAIVSYLRQGPHVPLVEMSFVIGIQGRGTLNIPGTEFMDLLATMTAQGKHIAGLGYLVQPQLSDEHLQDILAEELEKAGASHIAKRVREGTEKSNATVAALAALRRLAGGETNAAVAV